MSRPNLGYSNYYWIRQDQKRFEKLQEKLQAQRTTTFEPEPELVSESVSESASEPVPLETKPQESRPVPEVQGASPRDTMLPAPVSSGFPTWTKTVQNP